MRYNTLASDYDGTLACNGVVAETTLEALRRFKEGGRKLLLVTGREWEDLRQVFPRCNLFERIVAENGGLLCRPATGEARALAAPASQPLLHLLRQKGVQPLAVGRVLMATREPHEKAVLEAIHELGLEYQIIFNKGAVMILPSGVNKATGLKAALKELNLSPDQVAGIGDAENDHASLTCVGSPPPWPTRCPCSKRMSIGSRPPKTAPASWNASRESSLPRSDGPSLPLPRIGARRFTPLQNSDGPRSQAWP